MGYRIGDASTSLSASVDSDDVKDRTMRKSRSPEKSHKTRAICLGLDRLVH